LQYEGPKVIIPYNDTYPETDQAEFIAPNTTIIGNVRLMPGSSIWFGTVLRADISSITIGRDSNVQDNAVIHISKDIPTIIGDCVTVGHSAVLHSCVIENNCLIGMNATILDRAVIGADSIVAAGSVVPAGKTFPPKSMIMGIPAKVVRPLRDDEIAGIAENAQNYRTYATQYRFEALSRESID